MCQMITLTRTGYVQLLKLNEKLNHEMQSNNRKRGQDMAKILVPVDDLILLFSKAMDALHEQERLNQLLIFELEAKKLLEEDLYAAEN